MTTDVQIAVAVVLRTALSPDNLLVNNPIRNTPIYYHI